VLAGIATNGGIIADNIRTILSKISDIQIHSLLIRLDKKKPAQITLSEPFDFNNKVIIVVDDVSNSGKTMLYALKPLLDSHPKKIQTLVLVERTHKAFPVLSDYVGLSVATTLQEHIIVEVSGDHVTGAYLE
jgi:pyrimidine operon attenuation protein/uracil phosphoribosyltransferase